MGVIWNEKQAYNRDSWSVSCPVLVRLTEVDFEQKKSSTTMAYELHLLGG